MSTPIELVGISKLYGSVAAVEDISISIAPGKLTTILGPSGSGKSTMLSIIAGLTTPTAGRIIVGSEDITHLPAARRNIGLVFQSYALFPHMSVYDNVAFPLKVRRADAARVREQVGQALELVRMNGLADRKPVQLSGGQQQRVAIARAIVFQPSILLLDEPLAALDRKLREDVRTEIRQIQETVGITTILVTHDQEEALSLSDQVVVLKDGRVQHMAAPEEIYYHPATRWIAEFLGEANLFHARADGSLVLATAAAPTTPQDELVLIRPEKMHLGPPNGSALMTARVVQRVFLGSRLRYELAAADGARVLAMSTGDTDRYAVDTTVGLSWNPADLWRFGNASASEA